MNACGFSPYLTRTLTKRWVCRLQLLLVLASAVILRSESRGTHVHILLSQIRDSPNLKGQVPVFISPQEQGGVENIAFNGSSIVVCVSVATGECLSIRCLPIDA
jgi:hypothetical protein